MPVSKVEVEIECVLHVSVEIVPVNKNKFS